MTDETETPEQEWTLADAVHGLGMRLAVDEANVSWALFSIADAIDRLADAVADATKTDRQKPRR